VGNKIGTTVYVHEHEHVNEHENDIVVGVDVLVDVDVDGFWQFCQTVTCLTFQQEQNIRIYLKPREQHHVRTLGITQKERLQELPDCRDFPCISG